MNKLSSNRHKSHLLRFLLSSALILLTSLQASAYTYYGIYGNNRSVYMCITNDFKIGSTTNIKRHGRCRILAWMLRG